MSDDVVTLLQAEVEYWRAEAVLAREALQHLRSEADGALWLAKVPPEPPAGTRFYRDDTDTPVWERREDGWHCSGDDCRNCPVDWREAWEWDLANPGLRRELPAEAP